MHEAALCGEFIALSSVPDANRKRIARVASSTAAIRDHEPFLRPLLHSNVRMYPRERNIVCVRARVGKFLLPLPRTVYSSNTVSVARERVCLGPSRLRMGGSAKDAGMPLWHCLNCQEIEVHWRGNAIPLLVNQFLHFIIWRITPM